MDTYYAFLELHRLKFCTIAGPRDLMLTWHCIQPDCAAVLVADPLDLVQNPIMDWRCESCQEGIL